MTHTQYYIHHIMYTIEYTQYDIHKLRLDARVVFPVDSVSVSPDIQFHTNNPKSQKNIQSREMWCNYTITQGGGGWEERVTGAATLTKDYARKSYFIQIFDMQYCQQVGAALLCNTNCMLRKFWHRSGSRSSTRSWTTRPLLAGSTPLRPTPMWLGLALQTKGKSTLGFWEDETDWGGSV